MPVPCRMMTSTSTSRTSPQTEAHTIWMHLAAANLSPEMTELQWFIRTLSDGDAVASRDIHAAMYDAGRICKDL